MRLGVHVSPLEQRHDVVLELAVLADRLGYAAFCMGEAWGRDAFLVLSEIGARTERIRLVPTIVSIWTRTPAALAMATATLQEQTGGRFVLGLGTSSRALAEGFHDVEFERPLAHLRRSVVQTRALLRGERVPLEREARALRLGCPPAPDTAIYLAALRPAALGLTGELADGWLPYLVPHTHLGGMLAQIEAGRARRDPSLGARIAVAPSIPALVAPDPAEARRWVAWMLAFYLLAMGDVYATLVSDLGFAAELDAIRQANARPTDGVVPPEAERLLAGEAIWGDAAMGHEALARWTAAGADEPLLLLPPGAPVELLRHTLEAFAPGRP